MNVITTIGKMFFFFCCIGFSCLSSYAQDLSWAMPLGGGSADVGRGMATDRQGYVYTSGSFQGSVDFDPGPDSARLTSRGSNDVFVTKMDAAGNLIWAIAVGGKSVDYSYGLAVDDSGYVYVTGYFADTVDFDPGPDTVNLVSSGTYDIFTMKLDTTGHLVWARKFGGSKADYGYAVAVDKAGAVYTAGYFNGDANFHPGDGAADTFILRSNGLADIFISKLDAAGHFVWAKNIGGLSSEYCNAITTDQFGAFYLTGYFQGTVDFDPGTALQTLTASGGSTDIYVAKYDTAGNFLWGKSMGGSGADQGWGLATDTWGNVYANGYFLSTANFNPGPDSFKLTTKGSQDIYVVKWDSSGRFSWARNMGGSSGDYGYAIATDGAGNVYTTGRFAGTADFDPGADSFKIETNGGADIFVSKLDTAGHFVWAKRLGGVGSSDYGYGIAADPSGSIYVTGQFSGTATFGVDSASAQINAYGGNDAFLFKLFCTDTTSSFQEITADCNGYTLNGITYTETGTYRQARPNIYGCDSIITLELTIEQLNPVITVDGYILGTAGTYTFYQWYKNGSRIEGATGSTYRVTENAAYAVVVTDENGCVDTSNVYDVTNVTSIAGIAGATHVDVFPNPCSDVLYVNSSYPVHWQIAGPDGRIVLQKQGQRHVEISHLAPGVYFFKLTDTGGSVWKVGKLVKQ